MSEALDRCCNRFKEEINAAASCLTNVGGHVAGVSKKGVDALEADLHKALAKCEAKQEQAAHAGKRVGQFIAEVKKNAVNKFEDWRADRVIGKVEKQADKKEQQAVDAIVVAAYAILEAEVAILDALRTRKMAVEIAG